MLPQMAAWINVDDAAQRSGFCRKTIYRAIHAGELTARKVRTRWRISPDDLDAWIADGATPADTSTERVSMSVPVRVGSRAALRAIEAEAA